MIENKYKKIIFVTVLFSLIFGQLFCQEDEADLLKNAVLENDVVLASNNILTGNDIFGIWENGGRFVEFSKDAANKLNMRIVLKPYYRFVYDEVSKYNVSYKKDENSNSQGYLKIAYPRTRKAIVLPVCIENNLFFTSFYKKFAYTVNGQKPSSLEQKNLLFGFWVEQGNRDGILLYPNEVPKTIDAYFFTEDSYIKFRYWLDDLVYNEKKAFVQGKDGRTYEFPKFLKRGALVYSCITSNGRTLRNFETGTYSVNTGKNESGKENLSLSLHPQGSGPGTHSAPDTYPHPKFPVVENVPLYFLDNNAIFSIGYPYLERSKVFNLDEEIKKHNQDF